MSDLTGGSASELVIGVDGGGTKTTAWLASLEGEATSAARGRGTSGPGNPRAVGFDIAHANIEAAIDAAFADAKALRQPVAAVCLALAGAGRPAEQEAIASWAKARQLARHVCVCGDAEPVLAAASPSNVGIALIAGTGSLAWGRNDAGQTARCGGWGYLLGDEGSGYAIALAGLRAAVRSADGRGPETDLLPHYQQALRVNSPEQLIAAVYSPAMTRQRLAALAEIVFEIASTDSAAEAIVTSAARELRRLVTTLVARLEPLGREYTVALTGGTLLNQPSFRERVAMEIDIELLAENLPKPAQYATVELPVVGSVELARRAARQR